MNFQVRSLHDFEMLSYETKKQKVSLLLKSLAHVSPMIQNLSNLLERMKNPSMDILNTCYAYLVDRMIHADQQITHA